MKKLSWLFLLLPLLAALPGCGGGGTAQTWNYLVYMDGDNNLEQWGVIDLNEMERVGSSANLNIFVLFDRNPGWTSPSPGDDVSNGNWTNTRLYRVTRDNDINMINSQLLEDYPEKNMGNPNTLTEFIVYCQNNYPADRTVLVFWNHGGGVWPQAACSLPPSGRGVCFDDSSNGDCLTTSEVAAALTAARASTGKGVDLINLSVCLTQMLEVAYEWRNEADYLVGSEAVAWSPTNDYNNILNHLAANANISVRDLAVYLVDDYIAVADLYNISDVTYSALSLGAEFDTLVSYFQTFATSLRKTNAHSQVVTAWNNTTSFEFDGDYHECRDLYDFAAELTTYVTSDEAVTQAAADLRTAIAGAVIHHQEKGKHAAAGTDPAYGLSILIPTHDEWTAYYAALYPTLALSVDTDWNEFITWLP